MDQTIADIYHAAAGTKPWSVPLTRITQKLGLKGCQMVGVSTERGAVLFSHVSDGTPADAELDYIRSYHGVDPRIPLLLAQQDGQWLYDEDAFGPAVVASNPYYRDLLIPYGARHSATAKLHVQDSEALMVGFMSHLGDLGFTDVRRQFLGALSFHLCQAAAIHHRTRRLAKAALAGSELLERMERPALLLGMDRHVSFMNQRARQYLKASGNLLLSRDCLAAFHPQADEDLTSNFAGIAHDIGKGGLPQRRVVRLARRQQADAAVLSLTAFVPEQSMFAFGNEPQVLAVVHEPRGQGEPDLLLWEAAFDLTPSQSRVARALYLGMSISEAARHLQIAQTTVKSHLRELYAKTATSRQAHLLMALMGLQTV